ncbi:Anthranilate 1%2C2-dioxygenase system ferredoxin--NAD(+) reductase component [uncultured Clostridium sp.]|nr:Anthranilate 1%2C2-dioxygenase system ferredoxin--NAD(+) reductase component [uncultured Clostridium sp.]
MRYVIIGNSAGAIGCVEGIRHLDGAGEITLVSKEREHTYSRPLISYLLCGKTDEERMRYRPADFYEKMECQTRLGVSAVEIDRVQKQVVLEDGEKLPYDKLLIATGSRPFTPPVKGLSSVRSAYTFMTLEDAKALQGILRRDRRVLVLGAGLIGLKCVEGIAGKVAAIDVVDMADRILPSILDAQGAQMVQRHIEEAGDIRFHLGKSVASFEGNRAILTDGEELAFDILVVAVGVRPNVGLAKSCGLAVERGILTDSRCGTDDPDIFAAGDCTQSLDVTTGQSRILALLPNAYMQGECAGINMAGGQAAYDKAIAMNAIGFFGLHMVTAGSYDGQADLQIGEGLYKKLFIKEGRLNGYIIIGDVRRAGIYTALIRNQTRLDSLDFDLIREKPQLMAFSQKARKDMLGGVSHAH